MRCSLFLMIFLTNTVMGGDDVSPRTLGHIAMMFANFGKILSDPNDPKNVAVSICGIVQNIFSMASDTDDGQKRRISLAQRKQLQELQNQIEAILVSAKTA